MFIYSITTALAVGLANGANDNFKGVATLFGSGTARYRGALAWGTTATLAGSIVASLTGVALARALAATACCLTAPRRWCCRVQGSAPLF